MKHKLINFWRKKMYNLCRKKELGFSAWEMHHFTNSIGTVIWTDVCPSSVSLAFPEVHLFQTGEQPLLKVIGPEWTKWNISNWKESVPFPAHSLVKDYKHNSAQSILNAVQYIDDVDIQKLLSSLAKKLKSAGRNEKLPDNWVNNFGCWISVLFHNRDNWQVQSMQFSEFKKIHTAK